METPSSRSRNKDTFLVGLMDSDFPNACRCNESVIVVPFTVIGVLRDPAIDRREGSGRGILLVGLLGVNITVVLDVVGAVPAPWFPLPEVPFVITTSGGPIVPVRGDLVALDVRSPN